MSKTSSITTGRALLPSFTFLNFILMICLAALPVFGQSTIPELEKQVSAAKKEVKKAVKALDKAKDSLQDVIDDIADIDKDLEKANAKLAKADDDKARDKANKNIEKLNSKKELCIANKTEADKLVAAATNNLNSRNAALMAAMDALAAAKGQPVQAVTPDPVAPASDKPLPVVLKHKEWTPTEKTLPWNPAEQPSRTILKGDQELTVTKPASKDFGTAGSKYEFDIAMVAGDKDITEELPIWKAWAAEIPFKPVTADEIQDFYVKLVTALKEQGYIFAKVDFPTRPWANGIFVAKVDCGTLNQITVRNARHFSPEQLRDKLAGKDGKFNYTKVYGDLFDLNTTPDLKLQTSLKPVIQGGRQLINADIAVDDKIPIHGAIELRNDGSHETSDWRLRTSLQHLNVTDNFDTFTVEWLTGGLFKHVGEDLNALSASYFLPINDLLSFNVYGGWNQSDIDDVLPEIGVFGKGYFLGAQLSYIFRENLEYRQQISFNWFYQDWKNENQVNGQTFEKRSIVVSMPGITLGHVDKVFDSFKGRNFASLSFQRSSAGNFGASDKSDFNNEGAAYADGDFNLIKLQLARFQRFFDGEDSPGKWSLFMKTDVQVADDDLPPSLRDYVGGFNSVRGYEESEVGGDSSITATFELRTPLIENFIPGLKKDTKFIDDNPEYWGLHRLQFIAFTDFGYAFNKHEVTNSIENQGFASIGLGMRLGLTKYSQMSLDYGYPLVEASDDTPDAGRLHVSLQAQF